VYISPRSCYTCVNYHTGQYGLLPLPSYILQAYHKRHPISTSPRNTALKQFQDDLLNILESRMNELSHHLLNSLQGDIAAFFIYFPSPPHQSPTNTTLYRRYEAEKGRYTLNAFDDFAAHSISLEWMKEASIASFGAPSPPVAPPPPQSTPIVMIRSASSPSSTQCDGIKQSSSWSHIIGPSISLSEVSAFFFIIIIITTSASFLVSLS
jgi:hypothetical protein